MKRLLTTLAALALALAIVIPAGAITKGGSPDTGNEYDMVGLMVAQDANGNPLWRCSGTLLSPTLYLTAGHCTEAPAASAQIWFDQDVESGIPGNGYPWVGDVSGTTHTHPSYDPSAFFLFDLGVVVLDTPYYTTSGSYGSLPSLGQLEGSIPGKKTQFTAVGYGLQRINPVFVEAERVRYVANPHLLMINVPGFTGDFSIMLSNNASTGGTCFGDSGGPNFLKGTLTVAGVTSFGINGNCAGTGGVYRVDTADDLDWLYDSFAGDL